MSTPTMHRFSVSEYYRMAETGVLTPEARVELLDGAIHDMSPIGPLHGGIVNRLNRLFSDRAAGRWLLSVQNPVRLNDYSEPQPDMLLLKPAPDDYTTHHPVPDDVFLLIEVADSSLRHDQERKIPAYARAGIREVWIVNLIERVVEVYRDPLFTDYGCKAAFRAGDQTAPEAFPDMALDVSDLFEIPEA